MIEDIKSAIRYFACRLTEPRQVFYRWHWFRIGERVSRGGSLGQIVGFPYAIHGTGVLVKDDNGQVYLSGFERLVPLDANGKEMKP